VVGPTVKVNQGGPGLTGGRMGEQSLIGREVPLALLSAAIAAAGDQDDAILLTGEPGIGKTACLLAAQQTAKEAACRVVYTAGSEAEAAFPFAGLHRLLQPLLGLAEALPPVQRRGLLTALGLQDGPAPEPFLVSIAALGLMSEAARQSPLLIGVDNLQWLDEVSRQAVTFAARRLQGRHIAIIATSPSPREVPEAADAFREVRLPRLAEASARQLLERCAPDLDRKHRDWVLGLAAGNPLALTELAAMPPAARGPRTDPLSIAAPLSPRLEHAFADRLHELPGPSRDAVLVAALASDDSVQETLAATALLSEQDVTTAVLEPLESLGLLRYDETSIRFAHPLVKPAVAQRESLARRQAAHRALGHAVVVSSYRRAWHRANGTAGRDESVAADLELNSSVSIRRGDPAAAVMALERAAQLSVTSAERVRRLLVAAKQASDMRLFDIVDRLLAAAEGHELSGFDRVRADLLRDERDDAAVGDSDRILHLCMTARQAAAAGETGLALELAYAAANRRFSAHVSSRAVSAVTSLADGVAHDRENPRALAVLALAEPIRHGRRVISALADVAEETIGDADSLRALSVAAYAVGDYLRGCEFLDRAEAVLRRLGLHGGLVPVLCAGADIRLDLGYWERAGAELAEIGVLGSYLGQHPDVLSTAAKAAALRGETSAALELVAQAEHCRAARHGSSVLARAQIARGIAYISSGKHLDAYTALSRVFDPKDPSHHFREQFSAVMYIAEAALRCGQDDGARAIVERLEATADKSGSPLLLTQLQYARAVLAGDDTAERLFLDCLASDLARWPWPRARVQLAYGRWLRRQRRVRQSRAPLQAAQSALQGLGAAMWAREALDELEATGQRNDVRGPEFSPIPFSAQELKIARLAARGLSNSEIGDQLGLSPRTVGSHLYRLFPKLDISARGQLAARLAEQQLT
jgi:DNA-binding CsgD family transcriptional regulator